MEGTREKTQKGIQLATGLCLSSHPALSGHFVLWSPVLLLPFGVFDSAREGKRRESERGSPACLSPTFRSFRFSLMGPPIVSARTSISTLSAPLHRPSSRLKCRAYSRGRYSMAALITRVRQHRTHPLLTGWVKLSLIGLRYERRRKPKIMGAKRGTHGACGLLEAEARRTRNQRHFCRSSRTCLTARTSAAWTLWATAIVNLDPLACAQGKLESNKAVTEVGEIRWVLLL